MTSRMRVAMMRPAIIMMCGGVLCFVPASTAAQEISGGIAGVVTDNTGAVLPGVTVEASSPALIEQVRTSVTDGRGLYRILDLRPGVYSVTFTLPGFRTFMREGIELTTSFTATVNAEMSVGGIEETVTVTGAAPLVDVQNVTSQAVLQREQLDVLPTGKAVMGYAAMTVGISVGGRPDLGARDVGGVFNEGTVGLVAHGSRVQDQLTMLNGLNVGNFSQGTAGGGLGRHVYINHAATEEVVLTITGFAEYETSGVVLNAIPKEGGNTFSGNFNWDYGNGDLQSQNLDDALRARGVRTPPKTDVIYDVNGGVGGPLAKDRLWFFGALRKSRARQFVANNWYNAIPETLFYEPDLSRPADLWRFANDTSIRMTWQATPKHKIGGFFAYQTACTCHTSVGFSARPSGSHLSSYGPEYVTQFNWTAPLSNRLLLDVRFGSLYDNRAGLKSTGDLSDIAVRDLADGFTYRAKFTRGSLSDYNTNLTKTWMTRFSLAYVTGSHAFKAGVMTMSGSEVARGRPEVSPISYTFRNRIPLSITQNASPFLSKTAMNINLGIFAQDQWTIDRLTLNLGVRVDHLLTSVPDQTKPAGFFADAFSIPGVNEIPNWWDISPRVGVAYDLFGNGRTALKAFVGRFVTGEANGIARTFFAPSSQLVGTATRTWADDGDFEPNCDLQNQLANGECGQLSNLSFGTLQVRNRVDPAELTGWQTRPVQWSSSVKLEHEVWPGTAVTVGYFRRQYSGFRVTDNVLVGPDDYDPFCITAPEDPRLPQGGANEICGLYDIKPSAFGQVDNLVTNADNFGDSSTQVWNGFDVAFASRFGRGGTFGGGVNTGRTLSDNCVIFDSPSLYQCRTVSAWSGQTEFKLNGSYPLPGDFNVSAVFQALPGPPIQANYVATNAEIAPSLGRNLGRCRGAATCNGTLRVNLIDPNTMFDDRYYQLDLRLSKSVNIDRVRIEGHLDLYNSLNNNSVTQINSRFGGSWLNATLTQLGRLVKFGAQINF